jgi:hypothetical protein
MSRKVLILKFHILAEVEEGDGEEDDDDSDDYDSDDQVYEAGEVGLEEMLKDNIDEESEGNDYVLDEEDGVDQDSSDESDDDAGEADDSTANGRHLCKFIMNIILFYPIFV